MQIILPEGFPFSQFNLTYYSWCLVPVWLLQNVAPCFIISYIFLVLRVH